MHTSPGIIDAVSAFSGIKMMEFVCHGLPGKDKSLAGSPEKRWSSTFLSL